jgi:nucleoside-diphosphate-sugar epimerase
MITVLGGTGFIGSALVRRLQRYNDISNAAQEMPQETVYAPSRTTSLEELCSRPLGNVVYCIGVTADFRQRPLDTVRAHVSFLEALLRTATFDSLTYLSSTRIYSSIAAPSEGTHEHASFIVQPQSMSDVYNLSKLMGESLCLHGLSGMESSARWSSNSTQSALPRIHVVRLSNVVGNDFSSENFLASVIAQAVRERHVTLQTTLDSAKDYICIDDVVSALLDIVQRGTQQVYNLASGVNLSNAEIMEALHRSTGCSYHVADHAVRTVFPPIDIRRITEEFCFTPRSVLLMLDELIEHYKAHHS